MKAAGVFAAELGRPRRSSRGDRSPSRRLRGLCRCAGSPVPGYLLRPQALLRRLVIRDKLYGPNVRERGVNVANAPNKTTATGDDVGAFLRAIAVEQRRSDAYLLVDLMREVTGQPPVMWGTSIIGFGSRHYRYPSGREGDIAAVGFSPRKAQTVLYLTGGIELYDDLLARLGQHTTGKGCLYIKRVNQADPQALRDLIDRSYRMVTEA